MGSFYGFWGTWKLHWRVESISLHSEFLRKYVTMRLICSGIPPLCSDIPSLENNSTPDTNMVSRE